MTLTQTRAKNWPPNESLTPKDLKSKIWHTLKISLANFAAVAIANNNVFNNINKNSKHAVHSLTCAAGLEKRELYF